VSEVATAIAACWLDAERMVIEDLAGKYWDVDEEFITTALRCHLQHSFQRASECGSFEQALVRELQSRFTWAPTGAIERASAGFRATVTFHSRRVEGRTGGDLGIVLSQPTFDVAGHASPMSVRRQGLLIQAKLLGRDGRWGNFTARQREVLSGREDYLTLLLYRYRDDERRRLDSFHWVSCRGSKMPEIRNWLKRDKRPPAALNTETVIGGLAGCTLGTAEEALIDRHIGPSEKRASLVITLAFEDGSSDRVLKVGNEFVVMQSGESERQ